MKSHTRTANSKMPKGTPFGSRRQKLAFVWAVITCVVVMQTPALQAQGTPGITSPATGSDVSGDVPLLGTALIEPFQKYELHYKVEPSGDDAFIYFHGNTQPVINGQLGVWQASGLPPGIYSLRLRVVKLDGNYAEYYARNVSINQGPQPTPTSDLPTPTPIPTATFTPAPQPTPVVGEVAQPELASAPSSTPTPESVAIVVDASASTEETGSALSDTQAAADSGNSGSLTRELGEALSLSRLRTEFLNGIRISAALFLGIVALYAGKRLFDWVWSQFT